MTTQPLVALISATPAAEPPVRSAFAERFPEADLWGLLDDRLLQDAEARGGVTPELAARMGRLVDHAVAEGAEGVLLTCSVYGAAGRSRGEQLGIPVAGPDDAVFAAMIDAAPPALRVVATTQVPLDDSMARLRASIEAAGASIVTIPVLASEAFAPSRSGDAAALARAIVAALHASDDDGTPVFLAQYSLAPAAEAVRAESGVVVFTGPEFAADAMRLTIEAHR